MVLLTYMFKYVELTKPYLAPNTVSINVVYMQEYFVQKYVILCHLVAYLLKKNRITLVEMTNVGLSIIYYSIIACYMLMAECIWGKQKKVYETDFSP